MGFVVSKAIGNSVVRHRVTRRFREIIRPRLGAMPVGATCVLRALPGIDDAVFADLTAEVESALDAAVRKLASRTTDARPPQAPAVPQAPEVPRTSEVQGAPR